MPEPGGRNADRLPSRRWWPLWLALITPLLAMPAWRAAWGGGHAAIGSITGLVVVLLLTAASTCDALSGRIPNWSTYPALIWGMLLSQAGRIAAGMGRLDWSAAIGAVDPTACLLGGVVTFALTLQLYRRGLLGGGDVKVMTALAMLLPWEQSLEALILTSILGALTVIAALPALLARDLLLGFGTGSAIARWRRIKLPLGPYLAVGTLASFVLEGGLS